MTVLRMEEQLLFSALTAEIDNPSYTWDLNSSINMYDNNLYYFDYGQTNKQINKEIGQ